MTTIINGLLGGAVVAVIAALAAGLLGDRTQAPVTALDLSPGNGHASHWWSLLRALIYGSTAGGVLVALELSVLGMLAVPPTLAEAIITAVTWSVVLLAGMVALWHFLPSRRTDRSTLGRLVVFHLVYGLCLAVWIRLTWIT